MKDNAKNQPKSAAAQASLPKDVAAALASRKDAEGAIVARAWTDETFRKSFLADPKSTLEKVGITFPKGSKVVVHEESTTAYHFVLPIGPSLSGELRDAELEAVAGGTSDNVPTFHGLHLTLFVGNLLGGGKSHGDAAAPGVGRGSELPPPHYAPETK